MSKNIVKSTLPQFGRAYQVSVLTAPDANGDQAEIMIASDEWEPEALRVTFEICKTGYAAFWFADIGIYNANAATEQTLLKQGQEVIVKAGYQAGQYGEIFRGKIFQAMWERENVVDFKVTLHCMVGRDEITNNFVSMSHSRYSKQADLIARMAAQAHNPIPIQNLDAVSLGQKQLPRGKALFGSPGKYIEQAAVENKLAWWLSGQGLNLGPLERPSGAPDLTYGPGTGLIGTPQQTEDGVLFKTLLDPRFDVLMPPLQVELDMTAIRQMPQFPGNYFSILDQNGLYIVGAVTFVGDTRGTSWYSEVTGYTSVGGKLALLGETQDLDPRTP